jgi:hypothetical protein
MAIILMLISGIVLAETAAGATAYGEDEQNIFGYTSGDSSNTYVKHEMTGSFDNDDGVWTGTIFDDYAEYNQGTGYSIVSKEYEFFGVDFWYKHFEQIVDGQTIWSYDDPAAPPRPNIYRDIHDFEISVPDDEYCLDESWWYSEKTEEYTIDGADSFDIFKTYSAMCKYNENANLCVEEECCDIKNGGTICVDECCRGEEVCNTRVWTDEEGICCKNDQYNSNGIICCPNAGNVFDGGRFGGLHPKTEPCSIEQADGSFDSTCCKDNTWICKAKGFNPIGGDRFEKATCIRKGKPGGGAIFVVPEPWFCDTPNGPKWCGGSEEVCLANPICSQGAGCGSNLDCEPGQVCIDGACVNTSPGCSTDEDCPPGYYCLNGYCLPNEPEECEDHSDCTAPAQCINYICEPPPLPPGCEENIDCSGDKICDHGICVDHEGDDDPVEGCWNNVLELGEECEVSGGCPPTGRPDDTTCSNVTCTCYDPNVVCDRDMIVETGEECDPFGLIDPEDWETLAFCDWATCTCLPGYVPRGSQPGDCVPDNQCGNEEVNVGEECDPVGSDFGDANCIAPPNLQECTCEPGHISDGQGGCEEVIPNTCGNEDLEDIEECDPTGGDFETAHCNEKDTFKECLCGPGYKSDPTNIGECILNEDPMYCGDGNVQSENSEVCESSADCSSIPSTPYCSNCICSASGEPNNSIIELNGNYTSTGLLIDFKCKNLTDKARLAISLGDTMLDVMPGINCGPTSTEIRLTRYLEDEKIYKVELQLPPSCISCEKEAFVAIARESEFQIPDNNLLLVVLIGFISFAIIAIKKREE